MRRTGFTAAYLGLKNGDTFGTTFATAADATSGVGNYNIVPTDDDVWDPALFVGRTHVTPAERAAPQS